MESRMRKLTGVITALMTVADDNGKIDINATVDYAKHCVNGGVDGLFVSGTNGEGINFSVEDRLQLAKKLIEEVGEQVQVCIHTGASRLEDTIALTKGAYELGADCAAIVTPAFVTYEDEELYQYYVAVSSSVPDDFLLYMYNIPPRTGNDILPYVAEKIFRDCKNVVGMKASFCDLQRSLEYLSIDGMSLLQGSDVYQLEFLAMGCDGIISGLSGVYPVPFVKVKKAWENGDFIEARKWQMVCMEVCKAMQGGNVNVMQTAMSLKGLKSTRNKCANMTQKETLSVALQQLDEKIKDMIS